MSAPKYLGKAISFSMSMLHLTPKPLLLRLRQISFVKKKEKSKPHKPTKETDNLPDKQTNQPK